MAFHTLNPHIGAHCGICAHTGNGSAHNGLTMAGAGGAWPGRASPAIAGIPWGRPGGTGGCQRTEEVTADMAWTWRFEKMDGTPATARDLPKETFASQSDAETWLGESWRGLLEAGVDQVTLLEEGRTEYGPMSLHPED